MHRFVNDDASLETAATQSRALWPVRVATVWWAAVCAYYHSSTLARTAEFGRRALVNSVLVAWLTAEPDPEVIVIDLRETWTVGPIIRVLDRLIAPFERAAASATVPSAVRAVSERVRRAPVAFASATVLGTLAGRFALAWPALTDGQLGGYAVVAGVALLGLRVTASWETLAEGPVGRALEALLVPPEPPDESR